MSDIKVTKTIAYNSNVVTVEYDKYNYKETFLRLSFQRWYLIREDRALLEITDPGEILNLETAFNQHSWSIY